MALRLGCGCGSAAPARLSARPGAAAGPSRRGQLSIFFFNKFICIYIYFLVVLGLRCCAQAFSSCGERGLLFIAVHGLLIAVASLVADHGL